MKRFLTRIIIMKLTLLAFVSVNSVFAMAGNPKPILPVGVLSAGQVVYLFSGKSVATAVDGTPQDILYYFDQGGFDQNNKLIQLKDGQQTHGTWSVRKNGRLCIELKGEGRDCRMIVKENNQYNQYAVKRDNNHRYELTYVDFQDGNQLRASFLPERTLNKDEVIQLFSGKTVESVTATKGRVSHTYYDPNGELEQRREGIKRFGTWRVTDTGSICLKMEGYTEKCRIIVKEGNEYKKYIVKKSGKHQHTVSYRNFKNGKDF